MPRTSRDPLDRIFFVNSTDPLGSIEEALRLGRKNILFQHPTFEGDDISFLAEAPCLAAIEFDNVGLTDLTGLYSQPGLRKLRLPKKRPPIDLSRFPELEVLVIEPKARDKGLETLKHLHTLHLWRYRPKDRAIFDIALPPSVEELQINWCPAENIRDLGPMPNLKSLQIARCRNLVDLGDLCSNCPALEHLLVDSSGRVLRAEIERAIHGHPKLQHVFGANKLILSK